MSNPAGASNVDQAAAAAAAKEEQAAARSVDLTVHAESLIRTVSRAFYTDECIFLLGCLIRDKYLRDDDMGQRLSLPAKQIRKILQFLQREKMVKTENVNDLSVGGSQVKHQHLISLYVFLLFSFLSLVVHLSPLTSPLTLPSFLRFRFS